jgi:hypothetical protein
MFNGDERYINKSLTNELLTLQFNLRPFIFCVLKLKQQLNTIDKGQPSKVLCLHNSTLNPPIHTLRKELTWRAWAQPVLF